MTQIKTPNQNSLDHFFRGAFSIDMVLITFHNQKLKILLQEKKDLPGGKQLGLPGKLILPNEDTDEAIDNLMVSILGNAEFYKKQLRAFSELDRHPLGRIITFAYYGLIPFKKIDKNIFEELHWADFDNMPKLSLDHNHILNEVFKRFKKGLNRHPLVFQLLPEKFILSDITTIYEKAFNQKLDLPNFRKRILNGGLVAPSGEFKKSEKGYGRPAELYMQSNITQKAPVRNQIHFQFSA